MAKASSRSARSEARTVARTTLDNSPDNSLDIVEAATRLGLSTETVRKRLQRGKLKGFKTPEGVWRVVLPAPDSPDKQPGQSPDSSLDGSAALVTALRDEVAFLRGQLQARDEEIRRAHVLLQQAQQQAVRLLEPPETPPERRPWWRRWIG